MLIAAAKTQHKTGQRLSRISQPVAGDAAAEERHPHGAERRVVFSGKPYGSEYHSLYKKGIIKFIVAK